MYSVPLHYTPCYSPFSECCLNACIASFPPAEHTLNVQRSYMRPSPTFSLQAVKPVASSHRRQRLWKWKKLSHPAPPWMKQAKVQNGFLKITFSSALAYNSTFSWYGIAMVYLDSLHFHFQFEIDISESSLCPSSPDSWCEGRLCHSSGPCSPRPTA